MHLGRRQVLGLASRKSHPKRERCEHLSLKLGGRFEWNTDASNEIIAHVSHTDAQCLHISHGLSHTLVIEGSRLWLPTFWLKSEQPRRTVLERGEQARPQLRSAMPSRSAIETRGRRFALGGGEGV